MHLSLSEQTIKCHLNRIFKKTGLKNRNQLIKMFYNTLILSHEAKTTNGTTPLKEMVVTSTTLLFIVCNKDPEAFKKVMEKYEKERAEALKRLRERADEFSQEAS